MKKLLALFLIFCAVSSGAVSSEAGAVSSESRAGAATASSGNKALRGLSEPYDDSTVSATVTGRIASILKREGDFVKKGDIILELEKDEQEIQAEMKKRDWVATKKVCEQTQSISEEELWKKEMDYKVAQAQLNDRQIRAPFDGQVVKIFLSVGESCDVRQQLVRVVDTRQCRFITYLESTNKVSISKGKSVTVELNGSAGAQKFSGVVEYLSPVVDAASGLREIKVVLPNFDGKIKPGISGSLILSETK